MAVKLTLGYSSLASRVKTMVEPPVHENWEVQLILQNPKQASWESGRTELLRSRSDLSIELLDSTGVAKSRNRAIWLARGEYLVFSDDDIEFDIQGLEKAIQFLDENPKYSLLLGQAIEPGGRLRKRYPGKIEELNKINSARAATYEMIVRVDAIRQFGIQFDERFGAGADNYLGDEYIFIADLINAGLKAVFVPITIATHPEVSSGSGWGTDRDRLVRAKIFTRVFGAFAPAVRLAFGVRRLKELGSIINLLKFVIGR